MIVLAFLVLLQLQMTWCAYIASAIEGIGGTSYNTDAASVTSAIPTSIPSISPTYYPSLSPHSISVISTIAGTGVGSYSGDNNQATSATISDPSGIAIDSSNNVYFSDFNNHRIRKITSSTGIITTYAGTGSSSYSGDGGVATSASLYKPFGLCIDTSGNTFRSTDISNH